MKWREFGAASFACVAGLIGSATGKSETGKEAHGEFLTLVSGEWGNW